VGDFYEHFSNQGFFDSLVGRLGLQKLAQSIAIYYAWIRLESLNVNIFE
jgi:hypothetical protein